MAVRSRDSPIQERISCSNSFDECTPKSPKLAKENSDNPREQYLIISSTFIASLMVLAHLELDIVPKPTVIYDVLKHMVESACQETSQY